ncbi:DivIVA domain-containing protein [Streptomyces olivoreticuli]|uniref:DivIVA domain-containing protein n=1 Tax=Streptomyces olivoreticuli TaxID=68246 RepID=UPI000E27222A|nr:DivIVA domain-containing protein [Streptomyces olivoreticuli]
MLTPKDIRAKKFETVRLREGYDMNDVDGFLDIIENDISLLMLRVAELEGGLEAGEESMKVSGEEITASRLLGAAQETADRLLSSAREEAREVVEQANSEAEKVMRKAKARAEGMRQAAQRDVEGTRRQAEEEYATGLAAHNEAITEIERRIEELNSFASLYHVRMRAYIEARLGELEFFDSSDPDHQQPSEPARD